jgi:hypothetical protein
MEKVTMSNRRSRAGLGFGAALGFGSLLAAACGGDPSARTASSESAPSGSGGGGSGATAGGSASGAGPGVDASLYFSPSGDNSNPGTQASPKRDATGIDLNALPGGSLLVFARGGTYLWPMFILDNPNTSAAAPLMFDAYGIGALPILDAAESGILFGEWNNVDNDGGYIFRNLRLQGHGADASYGFFFMHNVHDVIIENMEIEGFYFGMQSQAKAPYGVTNVTLRNNSISRNIGMGILGQFKDTLIEGNLFEGNNFSGSGFEHGTYLSGHEPESGINITLRNNRYIRNSVVNGVCQGGNMTFHGQMSNVLIEGNRIEQDAAAPGCWAMSITQGYTTPEWFVSFAVRKNKIINAGNTGMNAQSAPGILVEDNVVINTQPTYQDSLSVGSNEYGEGDVVDGHAVVRNNTVCQSSGATGNGVNVIAPNSTVTNNVTVTGPAATTGICAP